MRNLTGKGFRTDYLALLCCDENMTKHAGYFCELLGIESVGDVWKIMNAFQIGDNENDRKSEGQGADNTAVFLLTAAMSPSVEIISEDNEQIEYIFKEGVLCKLYFNDEDQKSAIESEGFIHHSLYLLLKGCENGVGARVKIFK